MPKRFESSYPIFSFKATHADELDLNFEENHNLADLLREIPARYAETVSDPGFVSLVICNDLVSTEIRRIQ